MVIYVIKNIKARLGDLTIFYSLKIILNFLINLFNRGHRENVKESL